MKLKLKKGFEECYIYVPFIKANVMGKFIEEGLYRHLYKISPELFDIEPAKGLKQKIEEIKKDDLFIDNSTIEGDITEQ
jgi:hypothetical protein